MWKKCKVVLLPTTEKSFLFTKSNCDLEYNQINPIHGIKYLGWKYQHLYILSDDKIEVDDWMINTNTEYGCKGLPIKAANSDLVNCGGCFKIIATTNSSLEYDDILSIRQRKGLVNHYPTFKCLPSIPQSFITTYVSEYNKRYPQPNTIETIMVEYLAEDEDWDENVGAVLIPISLKINPDNTINIKDIKITWTKEEIIDIIRKYSSYKTREFTSEDLNWIEKNL